MLIVTIQFCVHTWFHDKCPFIAEHCFSFSVKVMRLKIAFQKILSFHILDQSLNNVLNVCVLNFLTPCLVILETWGIVTSLNASQRDIVSSYKITHIVIRLSNSSLLVLLLFRASLKICFIIYVLSLTLSEVITSF